MTKRRVFITGGTGYLGRAVEHPSEDFRVLTVPEIRAASADESRSASG